MNSNFLQEQERLNQVIEAITDQIRNLEEKTDEHREEVVEYRRNFWDDVKVNTDSFDDYLEAIIALRQQAQDLSVRQTIHKHSYDRLSTLQRMKDLPYFGRIDFKEEGTNEVEKVYIGVSTLTDPSGEEFLIYDWRTPVASVYYDYPPGPAKYETPGGTIHGMLESKWQYLIRGGKIQSMFDTSLTIGDEVLQEVLGKSTNKQMHSIVATIQQEQNQIIRHDKGRLLIVHGAAGSGKTSAALQRVAYLLYKYRDRLKADQIVLFSPNTMFNHYISNVLPELGEENMLQATFQEYLYRSLGGSFQVEGPYEQMEYVLTANSEAEYRTRMRSIQFKASKAFFELIKTYFKSLEQTGILFRDIVFQGETVITAAEISERFYSLHTELTLHNRLEKLSEWILKTISRLEKQERKKPWVQEEIELLDNDEYQKIYTHLQKKGHFSGDEFNDYDREIQELSKVLVRRKVKPLIKWIRMMGFVDIRSTYKQLFLDPEKISHLTQRETPEDWNEICQLTLQMLEAGKLYYEDATPFLLLKELILGFQTNGSIKYVFIDEAQDYSPFQFEFIKRLFPSARLTVLGDFNQAIFAYANETSDFDMLSTLYGEDQTSIINLSKSYRSTKPIIEFTRALLPRNNQIEAFNRDGDKPVVTVLNNRVELHEAITSRVKELRGMEYKTIAIICKSEAESVDVYHHLQHIEDIKLIKSGSMEYEQGVVIIPGYLAKGIEFDAVIVYDASNEEYRDESLRKLFYTICTRAMHELYVYSVGKPSPFMTGISEGLFVLSE
ncbi:RNA polymerase recycling motor HelD [Bacillus sp. PS06]|uniref:RNA polymerase recycling motor HelD n=1 Tax=Bacillus sp. PS06 TaxID=2764176 RepID=UPI001781D3D3|nr:RNA polymerase recycling motor HelD [Bacillus sp. PS06]MBD8068531.1 UvrD-helicase domain-containing protein [Bacillus sp. PS06]